MKVTSKTVLWALGGAAVGLIALAFVVLGAAGDPGGWAPWRIACVFGWLVPCGGAVGAGFGAIEDGSRGR